MQLTVRDRIILSSILPKVGNFVTLRTVRKLHETLALTTEERARYKLEDIALDDGRVGYKWDETQPQETAVELTAEGFALAVSVLREMNAKSTLGIEHLGLYEAFVVASDEANS